MAISSVYFQCLLGMQCNDFAMIAADQTNTMSIIVLKHDQNKLFNLSDKQIIGIIGDQGDSAQFTQFISKNVQLYKLKNGYQLSTAAAVHFIRKNLMESLKSGNATVVNMLVGGYDDVHGGELHSVDFLASTVRVPFGVHGFGGLISLGILDHYHRATLTESEAYEILKMCVHEIHERLFVSLPNFQVKVVNKHGIKTLPTITPATFVLENRVLVP